MTRDEMTKAKELLEEDTDRTEPIGADTEGGWALTAYWRTGGQRLFCSLAEVEAAVDEISAREDAAAYDEYNRRWGNV
jgi:hypothetical protein